jgi:hypothetical protein
MPGEKRDEKRCLETIPSKFLALAQHQLGRKAEARVALERLRERA